MSGSSDKGLVSLIRIYAMFVTPCRNQERIIASNEITSATTSEPAKILHALARSRLLRSDFIGAEVRCNLIVVCANREVQIAYRRIRIHSARLVRFANVRRR